MQTSTIRISEFVSGFGNRNTGGALPHKADAQRGDSLSGYQTNFSVLGISVASAVSADGSSGTAVRAYARLAADFARSLETANTERPNLPPAGKRHYAQVDTIHANRSLFPSGEFRLQTSLPGGAVLETQIAAALNANPSVAVSAPPAAPGLAALGQAVTMPAATTDMVAAAYGEWN